MGLLACSFLGGLGRLGRIAMLPKHKQSLVSNRAALDFCLFGNPCVRGVVGVDDDLLHAGDCMLGSLGTTSTTFHKVSQSFIREGTKKTFTPSRRCLSLMVIRQEVAEEGAGNRGC